MSGLKRSGRNRGSYLRRGAPGCIGIGSLEVVLMAIADSQASLDMADGQFELAAKIPLGTLNRLRQGKGYPSSITKITDFLESQVQWRA